jgi:hypothetical protein
MTPRLVLLLGWLTVLVAPLPARALIPGGAGRTFTDCYAEIGGTDANYPPPPATPKEIRCVDNDPSCDQDPTVGQCGIALYICLNVVDPTIPECTPQEIFFFDIKNYLPTNPKYDPVLTTLRDEVRTMVPLSADQTLRCTTDGGQPPVILTVPLRFIARTGTYRKFTRILKTHLDAKIGSRLLDDLDALKITCLPPTP